VGGENQKNGYLGERRQSQKKKFARGEKLDGRAEGEERSGELTSKTRMHGENHGGSNGIGNGKIGKGVLQNIREKKRGDQSGGGKKENTLLRDIARRTKGHAPAHWFEGNRKPFIHSPAGSQWRRPGSIKSKKTNQEESLQENMRNMARNGLLERTSGTLKS